jgi:hypothetical protein
MFMDERFASVSFVLGRWAGGETLVSQSSIAMSLYINEDYDYKCEKVIYKGATVVNGLHWETTELKH